LRRRGTATERRHPPGRHRGTDPDARAGPMRRFRTIGWACLTRLWRPAT